MSLRDTSALPWDAVAPKYGDAVHLVLHLRVLGICCLGSLVTSTLSSQQGLVHVMMSDADTYAALGL